MPGEPTSFCAQPSGAQARVRSHAWIDARSRQMAIRIAEKLRDEPALLDVARANIDRWAARSGYAPPSLAEWAAILAERELGAIITILTGDTEESRRLRQSSPFVGILSEDERRAIFDEYEKI